MQFLLILPPVIYKGKRMNTDPIADMLTRIRNANIVSHPSVEMPSSKLKVALAKLLKSEGFITDYSERAEGHFKYLTIELKYDEANKPVISNLKRVSNTGAWTKRFSAFKGQVRSGCYRKTWFKPDGRKSADG